MKNKIKTAGKEKKTKIEALQAAELLVNELIEEDPRLKMMRKQSEFSGISEDDVSDESVQIYRQRLRE